MTLRDMGFLLLHLLLCHYYCNSYVYYNKFPLRNAKFRDVCLTTRSLWMPAAEFDVS